MPPVGSLLTALLGLPVKRTDGQVGLAREGVERVSLDK